MALFHDSAIAGASGNQGGGGYKIERSLRFNSSDSAYLSRTPAVTGNRRTWTWAGWVKRSDVVSGSLQTIFGIYSSGGSPYHNLNFAGSSFIIYDTDGVTTFDTTQLFRDPSAWFHVVVARDTTQATASNRVKLYINGTQVTTFNSTSYPALNSDGFINTTIQHNIGSSLPYDGRYLSGYLADIHFIDGQALTPSSFTEVSATTGQLIPKAYTGSYGTNGFWLKFSDNSAATATTLGKDYSGNSNNWTPNNLSVTAGANNDSLVDTPTSYGTDTGAGGEVRGNYCTLNPLQKDASIVLTNGNLDFASPSGWRTGFGTIGVSSGKWYWEHTIVAIPHHAGIAAASHTTANYLGAGTGVGYNHTGIIYVNGGTGPTFASYNANDVIGVALNMDTGTIQFYKNGTLQGTGATGLAGTYFPAYSANVAGTAAAVNFGQRQWAYAAPAGFKALCDTNLPAPVVAKPNTVMDVKLYTGNGSTQTISGLGFSPDLVWIKSRLGATDHALYDVVRGTQARLESNTSDAEVTSDSGLTAFNSDGFSLGTLAQVNTNTDTYAAWCWDAGSTTVTNTQGSITSQVRANASAGFSVVTGEYFAGTLGHGLGVAPEMVIVRQRNTPNSWYTYHKNAIASGTVANNSALVLNGPSSVSNLGANYWNVTSTTISNNYGLSGPAVFYCFAPVAGYSSFGSYTGNGSADGPFVYLGFRPAVVLVKMSSSTGNWTILDDKREGYNVDNDPLLPNLSNAEGTTDLIDITSNGFKVRTTDATFNTNAGTYIYAAWASSPFQYARAR